MGMVFCRGCGKEIHETAPMCPHCGAPQAARAVAMSAGQVIPDGVAGWSWGAFLLNWIWAIGNRTWIGLLVLIPVVGWIMAIVLGIKGREWAWKNNRWDSVEHFNRVQKKWSFWAVVILLIAFVIGFLAAIALPAYKDYDRRAAEVGSAAVTDPVEIAPTAGDKKGAPATAKTVSLWSAEFKQSTYDGCAQAAKQQGDGPGVEACRCVMDKASTSIPEAKMAVVESDAEVRAAFHEVVLSCTQ